MVKLSTFLLAGALLVGFILIVFALFYGAVSADFAYNAGTGSTLGQYQFDFSANAAGGVAPYLYVWTFGDGAGAQGQFVQHTYTLPGTYTVNLTVSDQAGHKVRVSKDVMNPPSNLPTQAPVQPAAPHVAAPSISLVAVGVILLGVTLGAYVLLRKPAILRHYPLLVAVVIVVLTAAAAYFLVTSV